MEHMDRQDARTIRARELLAEAFYGIVRASWTEQEIDQLTQVSALFD